MPGMSDEKPSRIVLKNFLSESTLTASHASAVAASPELRAFTTASRVHSRPVLFENSARCSGQKHPGRLQMMRVSSSTMKNPGFLAENVRQVRAM